MKRLKQLMSYFTMLLLLTLISSCTGQQKSNESHKPAEITGKEYPKTGFAERFHPSLDQIIEPGEQPEILAEGFGWSEGPLWLPHEEMVIFSDIPKTLSINGLRLMVSSFTLNLQDILTPFHEVEKQVLMVCFST